MNTKKYCPQIGYKPKKHVLKKFKNRVPNSERGGVEYWCLFGIYKDLHRNIRFYLYTEVTFKKNTSRVLRLCMAISICFWYKTLWCKLTYIKITIGQHSTDIRVTPGMSERVWYLCMKIFFKKIHWFKKDPPFFRVKYQPLISKLAKCQKINLRYCSISTQQSHPFRLLKLRWRNTDVKQRDPIAHKDIHAQQPQIRLNTKSPYSYKLLCRL